MKIRIVLVTLMVLFSTVAQGAPKIVNPSFEADRIEATPAKSPRYRNQVQGWTCTGNIWVNPQWENLQKLKGAVHVFDDNGIVPEGQQVVVLQNRCTLSQRIDGFVAGKHYRVTYYENARRNSRSHEPPVIEVTLDGQTIVSPHAVQPVDEHNQRTLPYHFVESAIFTASHDGALDLVFQTTIDQGVSVLLDQVAIEEVPDLR